MSDTDKALLWQAYLAGFKRSAEGYNGEYPWYNGEDKQRKIKRDLRTGPRGFNEWYQTEVKDE